MASIRKLKRSRQKRPLYIYGVPMFVITPAPAPNLIHNMAELAKAFGEEGSGARRKVVATFSDSMSIARGSEVVSESSWRTTHYSDGTRTVESTKVQ